MKRTVALVFAFVLLLCGCAKGESFTPVLKGISFTADIKSNNNKYVCDCSIDKNGGFSLEVTSPKELKGIKTVYNGDLVSSSFLGLENETEISDVPVCDLLYVCISDASEKNDLQKNGANSIIKGEIYECEYSFSFSPSGLPISLEIAEKNYKCDFKNVTLIY